MLKTYRRIFSTFGIFDVCAITKIIANNIDAAEISRQVPNNDKNARKKQRFNKNWSKSSFLLRNFSSGLKLLSSFFSLSKTFFSSNWLEPPNQLRDHKRKKPFAARGLEKVSSATDLRAIIITSKLIVKPGIGVN